MKLLIIGAAGTIGKKVTEVLRDRHVVLGAGRNSGDIQVDIASESSIRKMYETLPDLDGVVCCAGEARWASLQELSEADFYVGIRSKLMGQINLVRIGQEYLRPGGSFTLTSGILAEDPVRMTTSAAMVNGGLHSFTLAAALELPRGLRINCVCAGLVEDSAEKYGAFFPGHNPVSMKKVTQAYLKSIEGAHTGKIIRVYE